MFSFASFDLGAMPQVLVFQAFSLFVLAGHHDLGGALFSGISGFQPDSFCWIEL